MPAKTMLATKIDDAFIERIAWTAHGAVQNYYRSGGDWQHMDWNAQPASHDSMIDAVRWLVDNPDASAKDAHERWMARRLGEGWVAEIRHADGPVEDQYDPRQRINPGLKPWAELSDEWRRTYVLVAAVTAGMTAPLDC